MSAVTHETTINVPPGLPLSGKSRTATPLATTLTSASAASVASS